MNVNSDESKALLSDEFIIELLVGSVVALERLRLELDRGVELSAHVVDVHAAFASIEPTDKVYVFGVKWFFEKVKLIGGEDPGDVLVLSQEKRARLRKCMADALEG